MAGVQFESVTKRFGDVVALDDLSLTVEDGEFLVLLGPSGCGKTTALRIVAGLEDASEGKVLIDGEIVNDVPPKDRDIAMVFQSYALYPHLTVRKNIEFPLRQRGMHTEERARRVERVAVMLHLGDLLSRKPKQLSGGQRQRVALARAIVREPLVYLMDEPLSNLDALLRFQTRAEVVSTQRELGTTVLYVTHDQVEAMTMGHRIAVMNFGRLQQVGPPEELYNSPVNTFVATFLGSPGMCLLDGSVDSGAVFVSGTAVCRTSLPDGTVTVGARPEHLALASDGVPAIAKYVEVLGADTLVLCELAGGESIMVRQPFNAPRPGPDSPVTIAFGQASGDVHLFDATSGQRLADAVLR